MYNLVTILFLIYTLTNLNGATKVNVEVTTTLKNAFEIFDSEELWGFEYVNKSAGIVKVNVVIDEIKQTQISLLNKNVIMSINTIYDDVDEILEKEFKRLDNRTRWKSGDPRDIFFEEYRDWIEYELFIADFVLETDIASISFMGETIQGRQIPIITLSTGGGAEKPGYYIQAQLHAREWLANAATTFIMNALGEGYGVDPDITEVLNNVNIFIVPTVNIDGYIYSWIGSNTRMWRKNRRNNGDGTFGVDLNRNYDAPAGQFCGVGASSNPNSDIYCGTGPFSEPECLATSNFLLDSSNNIKAAFDMHTFGPLVCVMFICDNIYLCIYCCLIIKQILYPWAYTYSQAPDYQYLSGLGDELQSVVQAVNGQIYTSVQASDLYPCAGTMIDYTYMNGIIESFCFEGRGPGFDPPPSNIIPAGQEQLAGVIAVAKTLY